jgi:fibronectin type 3 domain-containing protein
LKLAKMENRKGTVFHISKRPTEILAVFCFLLFILLLADGCGAPGEPTPPSPPVPAAITDLMGHQLGDGVQLSFTIPSNTIAGAKLATPPAAEILRGTLKPDGSPDPNSFRAVYTIPGAMVDNYRFGDQVRFSDPLAPEETKAHPGAPVAYLVRTRASQKRASADSNVVSVRVFPVPERISSVEVRVTESAIELSWPAPARTSAGEPLPAKIGYRIYRSELHSAAASPAPQVPQHGKREVDSVPLATSDTNDYRDSAFNFDQTYVYKVRSVIQVENSSVESGDSEPVTVTPRDTFPPAAPQGIVAAVLPGATQGTLVVDLSWSINLETDLAGYHVYRSGKEGAQGQLLTPDLLPTPAVRDTSVEPGYRYWYSVTAVDRAGNESAPSPPVAVDVTQPSS